MTGFDRRRKGILGGRILAGSPKKWREKEVADPRGGVQLTPGAFFVWRTAESLVNGPLQTLDFCLVHDSEQALTTGPPRVLRIWPVCTEVEPRQVSHPRVPNKSIGTREQSRDFFRDAQATLGKSLPAYA